MLISRNQPQVAEEYAGWQLMHLLQQWNKTFRDVLRFCSTWVTIFSFEYKNCNCSVRRSKNIFLKVFRKKGKSVSYKIPVIKALCGFLLTHNVTKVAVIGKDYTSELLI